MDASVGNTQSVVDASSGYLRSVNGANDQALIDADTRKVDQFKSVLEACIDRIKGVGGKVNSAS